MADRSSTLTKLGLGVLACNSGLAIYNSWGDAGSVGFVLVADAALLLLFLCLGKLEQRAGRGGRYAKTRVSVWALTTLLTAMFASRVAPPLMPLAVGTLVSLCLRELEGAQVGFGGHYAGLLKMGFGVAVCDSALDNHRAHGDAASLAFVFAAYAGFATLAWLFLRRSFDGLARGAGQQ